MTLPELREWAKRPPTTTPQALAVAEAVCDLFAENDALKEQRRVRAEEFVPLAMANADLTIYKRHNGELQAELARVREAKVPESPWRAEDVL